MTAYLLSLACRLMALVTCTFVAGWILRTGYAWTPWHTAITVLAAITAACAIGMAITCRPPWAERTVEPAAAITAADARRLDRIEADLVGDPEIAALAARHHLTWT